ncbi:MAG: hypothetical protein LC792_08010 [Actinobacteria bacterium]|nr:hypothetical protein [Actinomycetota bacterium]
MAGTRRALKDLTDALGAFGGPALVLSGVALLAGIVEVVVSPIAVIIRLFN